MGRPRKNRPKTPKTTHSGEIIILSDLAPDERTYIVTVQLDGHTARTLDRDQGTAWARTVLDAAMRAEHDAHIIRELHHTVGMPLPLATSVVADLRADRPPLDDTTTAPMRLEGGVNTLLEPFLAIHINDQHVGQWTCAEARFHAQGILDVITAVDLDAAYYRYLTGTLHIEPNQARNAVQALHINHTTTKGQP